MGIFFYNIFLFFYKSGISIVSLFNNKAKKWKEGRKNIFERLEKAIHPGDKIIWIHCASLGEFEQGRPVLETIRSQFPNYRILLTFFSPSGFEVRKNYDGADHIFYLPMDGPGNAKRFLEIVHPSLVIFVKYEFWYYYLKYAKEANIPLLLISALFRKNTIFFKWYGGLQRKMLHFFDHLFVQNISSKQLLESIGITDKCTMSGDTRFDRVIEIAEKFTPIEIVEKFIGDNKAIVAGSTWKEDEEVLQKTITSIPGHTLKLIIAPHEIDNSHLDDLKKLFPGAVLYSQLASCETLDRQSDVLIIDNFGMLSRLYHYGYITFVGGGLRNGGVHNVLEAAVHGKPVLYGPVYEKYTEAIELIASGGGICIRNREECTRTVLSLLNNQELYENCCSKSSNYVRQNKGATEKIIRYIQVKRLLTI